MTNTLALVMILSLFQGVLPENVKLAQSVNAGGANITNGGEAYDLAMCRKTIKTIFEEFPESEKYEGIKNNMHFYVMQHSTDNSDWTLNYNELPANAECHY